MIFKLFSIFIIVMIMDVLILPAFFGLRESFLTLLILIVPILYIGSTGQSVAYGLFFAFIYEFLRGLDLGTLVLPFLLTAVVIYSAQRFLDIKYTYEARFGFSERDPYVIGSRLGKSIFIALMSLIFIYIFSFFYRHGSVNLGYFDPTVGLTIALEALILVFVFNIVFNKKNDYQ